MTKIATISRDDSAPLPAAGLDSIRTEIDRIDDALLMLIEERMAAAHAVAIAKQSENTGRLNLRPARESQVIDRLAARSEAVPAEGVASIWRALMAVGLQAQARTEIVVHAAEQPVLVTDQARRRFGCSAPLLAACDPEEALDHARAREAVAVIEVTPLSGWWIALAGQSDLAIVDCLRDRWGAALALVVGRVGDADRAPGPRFEIVGEGSLRTRLEAGEPIRPIAMCGHLRLCMVGEGAAR